MTKKVKTEPGYIHEAMHLAWVLGDTFDRYVVQAPAVQDNEKAAEMAEAAHARMWELYQYLGEMLDPS